MSPDLSELSCYIETSCQGIFLADDVLCGSFFTFSTSAQHGLKLKVTERNGGIYDCSDPQRREVQKNAGTVSAKTSGVYRTGNPVF